MNHILIKFIPLAALLPLFAALPGCGPSGANSVQAQGNSDVRRVPVAMIAVEERPFEERVSAQGTLVAKHYAMIAPRVDGIVTDMFVEEGDRVESDKTPLFQIDKVVLTEALEIARQDLAVAECARVDAEAMVVAAQAQHDKAKLDYERFQRLFNQQAITPDAMEQMEAGFTVAKAQLNRAKTAVKLYEEQAKKAQSALVISEKRLADSLIFSPLDGWVTYKGKKPGEFAGAGTPILRVADTSVLEVSAFLPYEYYPRMKVGETQLRITVSGIELGSLPITYKSPEIQDQLRTFEVKCLVESPPEGVVPGAIANVEAILESRKAPGIPTNIIQMRGDRSVIFTVEDDTARMIEIRAGLATDGWTELLDGQPAIGTPIIRRGYNLVNDGSLVEIQREEQ